MANYQDSHEPSTIKNASTAIGGTARGFGLGVLASIAAIAAPFFIIPALWTAAAAGTIGIPAGIGLGIFTVGASLATLVAGPMAGALFGAQNAVEKIDRGYATSTEAQKAKSIIAAQEREMGRAEAYAEMNQPRSTFMAQAPVFVTAGECPHCKVNNMNYQGQAVALQHGIVS